MVKIDIEFGVILCLSGRMNEGFGETFVLFGQILDLDIDMEMDLHTS
jgi:hypothetical protein